MTSGGGDGFDSVIARINTAHVGVVDEVAIPAMPTLEVSGRGWPGGEEFRGGVRDLYALAFAVKLLPRTVGAPVGHHEYEMPPMQIVFESLARDTGWTILFPQPAFVTAAVVDQARAKLDERGADTGTAALGHSDGGPCLQTLHLGPFEGPEIPAVSLLQAEGRSRGYVLGDRHHEVVLDDPQKVDPAERRTIMRYPIV